MPVVAIYDDHDFAFNDVKGAHMPPEHRDRSQQVPWPCVRAPCGGRK
jgi:hypothetical protein